jgi:hypothetical protein
MEKGNYWAGKGEYQKQIQQIWDENKSLYGGPDINNEKAVLIWLLNKIQHESYNNGFLNTYIEEDDYSYEEDYYSNSLDKYQEYQGEYDYLYMLLYLYKKYNFDSAGEIVDTFLYQYNCEYDEDYNEENFNYDEIREVRWELTNKLGIEVAEYIVNKYDMKEKEKQEVKKEVKQDIKEVKKRKPITRSRTKNSNDYEFVSLN